MDSKNDQSPNSEQPTVDDVGEIDSDPTIPIPGHCDDSVILVDNPNHYNDDDTANDESVNLLASDDGESDSDRTIPIPGHCDESVIMIDNHNDDDPANDESVNLLASDDGDREDFEVKQVDDDCDLDGSGDEQDMKEVKEMENP